MVTSLKLVIVLIITTNDSVKLKDDKWISMYEI